MHKFVLFYYYILYYLYNPQKLNSGDYYGIFKNSDKVTILNTIVELLKQLYNQNNIVFNESKNKDENIILGNFSLATAVSSFEVENKNKNHEIFLKRILNLIVNEKLNSSVTPNDLLYSRGGQSGDRSRLVDRITIPSRPPVI